MTIEILRCESCELEYNPDQVKYKTKCPNAYCSGKLKQAQINGSFSEVKK